MEEIPFSVGNNPNRQKIYALDWILQLSNGKRIRLNQSLLKSINKTWHMRKKRRGRYELKSETTTQKMRRSCWVPEGATESATQFCSKVGLLQP